MNCALLAPAAGNQQLFTIHWDGYALFITSKKGFLEKVDIGIVKYHFEFGSSIDQQKWR